MINNTKLVEQALGTIDTKGIFRFVAVTEKSPLKKSRITKEATPERFSTVFKISDNTVSLGNSYEDLVNGRLEKEGKDANFQSKGTYCHPKTKNRLVWEHNENGQKYLRVYIGIAGNFNSKVRYIDADGVDITADWEKIEAEYFTLSKSSNESQGLDNPIFPLNYKLENVIYLKRGEIEVGEVDGALAEILKGERDGTI